MQFPNEKSPSELYTGTWSNITSTALASGLLSHTHNVPVYEVWYHTFETYSDTGQYDWSVTGHSYYNEFCYISATPVGSVLSSHPSSRDKSVYSYSMLTTLKSVQGLASSNLKVWKRIS